MILPLTPGIVDQIERYMGDRERCMPSERKALEAKGFVAKERLHYGPNSTDIDGTASRHGEDDSTRTDGRPEGEADRCD